MTFLPRAIALLASLLIVLMTIGCEAPAGSSGPDPAAVRSPRPSPGADASHEAKTQRSYDIAEEVDSTPSSVRDSTPTAAPNLGTAGPEPVESSFSGARGTREADDPFAVIGPAFSGMGFQSYSSSCDPFEDKYGTCL